MGKEVTGKGGWRDVTQWPLRRYVGRRVASGPNRVPSSFSPIIGVQVEELVSTGF